MVAVDAVDTVAVVVTGILQTLIQVVLTVFTGEAWHADTSVTASLVQAGALVLTGIA